MQLEHSRRHLEPHSRTDRVQRLPRVDVLVRISDRPMVHHPLLMRRMVTADSMNLETTVHRYRL